KNDYQQRIEVPARQQLRRIGGCPAIRQPDPRVGSPSHDQPALGAVGGVAGRATGATRQTMLARSSATNSALPIGSTATPTGRPRAFPFSSRKSVTKSCGLPTGRPAENGIQTT